MTNFYTQNADGSIRYYSNDAALLALQDPDQEQLTTEKNIVTGYDGKLYFEGAEPQKPQKMVVAEYEAKIQARLDDFTRTLTYDGILSACTYATSAIEMYRIEGQYCVEARDATWAKAFELLSAFQPGDPVPTWEEIEAELPPLAWPEGSRGYIEPSNE